MSVQKFVLQMNSDSKYREMETVAISDEQVEHYGPMRRNLTKLFHSYRFHLLIIALVVVDCLIVVTELIIELNILSNKQESRHSTAKETVHVLHIISIVILSVFAIEVILKIYAFRIQFFKSWMEMFDAFVIIVSLVLDIVFFGDTSTTSVIGDLIIVLRLWRIVRVIHGIVLSVKTPIEHSLEKERKHRENVESQLHQVSQYASALESEVLQLREVLKVNEIDVDIPQTLKP